MASTSIASQKPNAQELTRQEVASISRPIRIFHTKRLRRQAQVDLLWKSAKSHFSKGMICETKRFSLPLFQEGNSYSILSKAHSQPLQSLVNRLGICFAISPEQSSHLVPSPVPASPHVQRSRSKSKTTITYNPTTSLTPLVPPLNSSIAVPIA